LLTCPILDVDRAGLPQQIGEIGGDLFVFDVLLTY
jgi:hypothetical protein